MTNNNADLATILSVSGAILSIADIQPIVTLIASLVAIVSGIFAIRYYIKATNKIK
jgi:hypothetical protein|tara:strand:+ start:264 stop:431 length:168 start_codon:yes stop_codon:yes gene_type:complete